jgi:hypothetical protein
MQQKLSIESKLLCPLLCFKVILAVSFGELVLGAGLLGHLEEEQEGQFGYILVIGDAVIPEDVAEVPQSLNNIPRIGHGKPFRQ